MSENNISYNGKSYFATDIYNYLYDRCDKCALCGKCHEIQVRCISEDREDGRDVVFIEG